MPPIGWVVRHGPDAALSQVELLLLREGERTGADAAEDADLVAALVDGAVAVEAAADGEGFAAFGDRVGGDEARRRAWGEAHVAGGFRRGELDDAQAVLAVGEVGELADVGNAEL